MLKVYKYEVEMEDYITITLPKHAKILTFDMQGDKLCAWALVNPNSTITEDKIFRIAGTGHPINDNEEDTQIFMYVNTFQLLSGKLIFHVFEVITI